jgi:18S rRNA (adenine1779-N6/adenine1780-N6)-dimethyltransferase
VRLCFGRKNKTLGGIFRQAPTLALLESNHAVHAALAVSPAEAAAPDAGAAAALAAMALGDGAPAGPSGRADPEGEDADDSEEEDDDAAGMDLDGRRGASGSGRGASGGPQGGGPRGAGPGGGRAGGKRGKRGRASEGFKARVLGVLAGGGFEDARSAKLAQDDFLRLLAAFNRAGIHFA